MGLRREIKILSKIDHENVVKFYDFFDEVKFCYIVMEYVAGGQLFESIVRKVHYTELEARNVIFSILSAAKYCHSRDIVHR
jgi:serine/threonine protein kinase